MNNNYLKPQFSVGLDDRGFGGGSQQQEMGKSLKGGMYHSLAHSKLLDQRRIGLVKYRGDDYTFAYPDAVGAIYKEQHIQCINFDSFADFTLYLKYCFEEYRDLYPHLWKIDDRSSIKSARFFFESMQLSQLIKERNLDLQIPELGYIRDGERVYAGKTITSWLPFMIDHKPIRMRYSPGVPKVSFDAPDNRACVISIFNPRPLPK